MIGGRVGDASPAQLEHNDRQRREAISKARIAVEMRTQGKTFRQIGLELGVYKNTVRRWFTKYGMR
jgi:hypothetical protein